MDNFGRPHNKSEYQLQPLVLPQESHFMQVPFRPASASRATIARIAKRLKQAA
jgi:hypothetical protein